MLYTFKVFDTLLENFEQNAKMQKSYKSRKIELMEKRNLTKQC